MEIIGLLILLIIGSAVVYYLDLHTTIWNALKERYASYIKDLDNYYSFENIRDRATKNTWKEIRTLEKERSNTDTTFNDHIKVHNNGSLSVDPNEFIRRPEVQRQIKGMQRLFRRETLRALHNGKEPPESIGEGRWTKEKIKENWDDEWQADLEAVNLTHEQFFGKSKDQFVCSPRTRLDSDLETIKLDLQKMKLDLEKEFIIKLKNEIASSGLTLNTVRSKDFGDTNSGGPK